MILAWAGPFKFWVNIFLVHYIRAKMNKKQIKLISLLTQKRLPLLVQCWASVVDIGSTLIQQWVNDLCLLGIQ